jgi:hypothetical protein
VERHALRIEFSLGYMTGVAEVVLKILHAGLLASIERVLLVGL